MSEELRIRRTCIIEAQNDEQFKLYASLAAQGDADARLVIGALSSMFIKHSKVPCAICRKKFHDTERIAGPGTRPGQSHDGRQHGQSAVLLGLRRGDQQHRRNRAEGRPTARTRVGWWCHDALNTKRKGIPNER